MIFEFLKNAIKPISQIIDEVHTSDEEKGKLKNELAKIESTLGMKMMDYHSQVLASQSKIIVAEAQGGWLKSNWRPITMLTFLVLVVCDSFGILSTPLAPEAWGLLKIGLGGYVIGRSGEKMIPKLIDQFGSQKKAS